MSGTITDNSSRVPMKTKHHFMPLDDATLLYFHSQAVITQKAQGIVLENSFVNMSYKIFLRYPAFFKATGQHI